MVTKRKVAKKKSKPARRRSSSPKMAAQHAVAVEACRGDYIATLRKIADDPDPELRQRVLGLLAREKDGYAQKTLLEGLHDPAKALLPPDKALQLLSYDVHADAYAAARAIVKKPPNEMARREALRLLAADATAAPMFEKLVRDKNELREIRQISASALSALKPERLQKSAREILLDNSDYDDIKATSLTALTQLGDEQALSEPGTSPNAAVASAAYHVMGPTAAKLPAEVLPDPNCLGNAKAVIDGYYAAALAVIPADTPEQKAAKENGIALGKAAADAVLAKRANDKADTGGPDINKTSPPATTTPGKYQCTPGH